MAKQIFNLGDLVRTKSHLRPPFRNKLGVVVGVELVSSVRVHLQNGKRLEFLKNNLEKVAEGYPGEST